MLKFHVSRLLIAELIIVKSKSMAVITFPSEVTVIVSFISTARLSCFILN